MVTGVALGAGPMEQSLASGGKVLLHFTSTPLMTMTETPFAIDLTSPSGNIEEDAVITLGLDMPAMPMPPNHPQVVFRDGHYQGTAVFTMAGAWQVEMMIRHADGVVEQVVFDIDKVLMKCTNLCSAWRLPPDCSVRGTA